MGRSPRCDQDAGVTKGPWSPEEDELLRNYVLKYGLSSWGRLPKLAGLNRSGQGCRLRWTNYLRPGIKRGAFDHDEEELIIQLHSILGNKWSSIASNLPGRTDNEIKNYWNTHLRKKLLSMEGWNNNGGGRGSYREEISGSVDISSSRSGTIVSSTAYTSSGASRLSTFSAEAGMHFDSMAIHEEEEHAAMHFDSGIHEEEEQEKRRDRIRSLVQEFSIAPSANCSVKIGGMSVVERWLTELGVGWVLSLDDFASAGEELNRDLRRWIRALDEISQIMCFMRPIFPDIGSMGLPSIGEEEGDHVSETCSPTRHHLVLFIQEAMLKMLSFVDVIVALDTFYSYTTEGFPDPAMALPLYNKLIALLGLHDSLSEASNKIESQFGQPASMEVKRIENEMTIILLANKSKVGEAIWSKMENIRTKSMEEDSLSSLDPHGSSDIHKVTRSIVMYIKFLCSNDRLVDAAIRDKYMRDNIEHVRPLDSMISEVVSCLEEKLANISKSFPDEGLMFLFLLNNFNNIMQSMQELYQIYFDLTHKIEGHMERYVEVSWAPLLSCLINPMPLCLGKNCSPLSKFESEFHKIYTTQKQWKVPDPELRRKLRMSIRDKIIPAYTEYLEDNKVATPKFTLQELDEMLQEMFEG